MRNGISVIYTERTIKLEMWNIEKRGRTEKGKERRGERRRKKMNRRGGREKGGNREGKKQKQTEEACTRVTDTNSMNTPARSSIIFIHNKPRY